MNVIKKMRGLAHIIVCGILALLLTSCDDPAGQSLGENIKANSLAAENLNANRARLLRKQMENQLPSIDPVKEIKHRILYQGVRANDEPISLPKGLYYFTGDQQHVTVLLTSFMKIETNLTVREIFWLEDCKRKPASDEMTMVQGVATDLDLTNGCFILTMERK